MHHSSKDDLARENLLKDHREQVKRMEADVNAAGIALGPTGRYPEGKLNDLDEGEFRFQIGSDGRFVYINFGAPIQSFALDRDRALDFARLLKSYARKCDTKPSAAPSPQSG